jgi:Transglycosylase-like domain.
MADPVQDFVSPQNLFNLSQGGSARQPEQPSAADASVGMDTYMPPLPNDNVIPLPQLARRRYFSYDAAPAEAQAGMKLDSLVKTLTNIVKAKESTDNYQAVNTERKGNTASGAYQYTDATWNNYGGYPKAALAPPEVQDRRFKEDIIHRLAEYGGDPYKAIAAHYLPALADDPTKWDKAFKVHGRKVKPVAAYVRYITKDTPLEAGFDEYLAQR